MVANLWEAEKANAVSKGVEELVYRSNLLGTDRAVANWGGGNTSMKTIEKDFRGRDVEVMWVKGSGSDLGNNESKQFHRSCEWMTFVHYSREMKCPMKKWLLIL